MIRIVLGGVYGSPPPAKRKYRQYSPNKLQSAYQSAIDGDLSVRKASKVYGVPMQTLRDRVLGHVEPETLRSGPGHLLSQYEEAKLVDHIKEMAIVGYPYTRAEVINIATEFAISLGKRSRDTKHLTFKWFYGFLGRWPELKVQRPKTITELRAKATSRESISNYFQELENILVKYDLKNAPECIYNIDEKGVQTNFKPNCVVGPAGRTTSVITSERSATTTILGCGSAIGQQIPPYFVFAGARMRGELLEDASAGADGTVSKSGWSNGEVFQKYLETHFIKYAVGRRPLLLLYDGHRSHISPFVIDWATSQNIILYVLPPHTSHILQPMDVGCFGPFSKIYSNECKKFQRTTGRVVDRYSICSISCKAYTLALSVKNLQSAFHRSGIYPFNPDAIDTSLFKTNDLRYNFQTPEPESVNITPVLSTSISDNEIDEEPQFVAVPLEQYVTPLTPTTTCSSEKGNEENKQNSEQINAFFVKKRPVFKPPFKSERRSISSIIAGKAITEPDVASKVKEYIATSQKISKPVHVYKKKVSNTTKNAAPKPVQKHVSNATSKNDSQKPSTSGTSRSGEPINIDVDDDDDDDDDDEDTETCCVCRKFQPKELANCISITFVKWAKCDFCDHWTHLIYCSEVRVIRRGDVFRCPHCANALHSVDN